MNTFIRHLGRTKAEEVFTTENVKDRQREHNHESIMYLHVIYIITFVYFLFFILARNFRLGRVLACNIFLTQIYQI